MEIEVGNPEYALEVLEWFRNSYPADQHNTPQQQGRRPGYIGIIEWVNTAIAEIRKNDEIIEERLKALPKGYYEFTVRLGMNHIAYINSSHEIFVDTPSRSENDFRWALLKGCVWRLDRTMLYDNHEDKQVKEKITKSRQYITHENLNRWGEFRQKFPIYKQETILLHGPSHPDHPEHEHEDCCK
jgi:hypothetical protein